MCTHYVEAVNDDFVAFGIDRERSLPIVLNIRISLRFWETSYLPLPGSPNISPWPIGELRNFPEAYVPKYKNMISFRCPRHITEPIRAPNKTCEGH